MRGTCQRLAPFAPCTIVRECSLSEQLYILLAEIAKGGMRFYHCDLEVA